MILGIFDSGLGGLTVLKEIVKDNVFDKIIYYGDTKRIPYGDKDKETLFEYAKEDIAFLREKGAQALVVACGTISSNVLEDIKKDYDFKMVGIIDVACKEATTVTNNNRIGVIATNATINTHAFKNKLEQYKDVEVYEVACQKFAPLIESGKKDSLEMDEAIKEYLSPLKEKDVDTIIYGCTHYPILEDKIKKFMNKDVNLINSGKLLSKEFNVGEKKKPIIEFYVSGDVEDFKKKAKQLIDIEDLNNVNNK